MHSSQARAHSHRVQSLQGALHPCLVPLFASTAFPCEPSARRPVEALLGQAVGPSDLQAWTPRGPDLGPQPPHRPTQSTCDSLGWRMGQDSARH